MKWLIYLSLLIGGAVLLGDLVAVIMTFLEGEITQRFVLKALAVLAVIGAAFYYYLLDARGWWIPREKESVYYGVGAALVALVAVVYGFTLIESPASEQEQNIDQRQIQDLTTIQNRIETYYVTNNNTLPESLDRLQGGVALPEAPEGRGAYEYRKSAGGFELCATFAYPSQNEFESQPAMDNTMLIKNAWDWGHGAGYYCFERVVSAPVKS